MSFSLSSAVNPPTVFLLKRSRLRGRLDAEYNFALLTSRITSKYPQKKLREVASFRTGGTPSKSRSEYWEGEIPWASPKDFRSFYLTETEDHISQEAISESATTLVAPGTLLVVFRSGILQHSLPVTITTKATAINQDLKAIIFDSDVSAEYVGVYFVIFGRQLLPLIIKSGATVQSINTEQFEQLEIPIPPKEVQSAVITKLLNAFKTAREKENQAQQLLASIDTVLLNELGIQQPGVPNTIESRIFTRALSEVSGGRLDPIANQEKRRLLVEAIHSGRYPVRPLRQVVHMEKNLVDSISPTDIYLGLENIEGETGEFIAKADKESVGTAVKFRQGQILFPKLRPYLNKTHLASFDGLCSTEFHVFTPLGVRGDYLAAFLRSRIIVGITSLLMTGNTLPRLQTADIEQLPIPIPPRSVQERLCAELSKLKSQAAALRAQAADELAHAKQSIESMILKNGSDV